MYLALNGGKSCYYLRTKSRFTTENTYRFNNQKKITIEEVEKEKQKDCEISVNGNVCVNCD
jgi:hypothetical protein